MKEAPDESEKRDPASFSLKDHAPHPSPRNFGQYASDLIAGIVGSWRFIIVQAILLTLWIALNIIGAVQHWDPYPFILLNLVLSFQAAFTAPVIMMAQNRQSEIDRHKAQLDYKVNLKAELDISSVHQKLDRLRDQDIARLIVMLEQLTNERLASEAAAKTEPSRPPVRT